MFSLLLQVGYGLAVGIFEIWAPNVLATALCVFNGAVKLGVGSGGGSGAAAKPKAAEDDEDDEDDAAAARNSSYARLMRAIDDGCDVSVRAAHGGGGDGTSHLQLLDSAGNPQDDDEDDDEDTEAGLRRAARAVAPPAGGEAEMIPLVRASTRSAWRVTRHHDGLVSFQVIGRQEPSAAR